MPTSLAAACFPLEGPHSGHGVSRKDDSVVAGPGTVAMSETETKLASGDKVCSRMTQTDGVPR